MCVCVGGGGRVGGVSLPVAEVVGEFLARQLKLVQRSWVLNNHGALVIPVGQFLLLHSQPQTKNPLARR